MMNFLGSEDIEPYFLGCNPTLYPIQENYHKSSPDIHVGPRSLKELSCEAAINHISYIPREHLQTIPHDLFDSLMTDAFRLDRKTVVELLIDIWPSQVFVLRRYVPPLLDGIQNVCKHVEILWHMWHGIRHTRWIVRALVKSLVKVDTKTKSMLIKDSTLRKSKIKMVDLTGYPCGKPQCRTFVIVNFSHRHELSLLFVVCGSQLFQLCCYRFTL